MELELETWNLKFELETCTYTQAVTRQHTRTFFRIRFYNNKMTITEVLR